MSVVIRHIGARALRCLTLFVFVAGPAALISGCGDDSVGGGPSGGSPFAPPGTAELQCRNLTEEICEMLVDCGEMPSSEYLDCVHLLDSELDCDLARSTSTGYQSCMNDLRNGCYTREGGLPSSCTGVILI